MSFRIWDIYAVVTLLRRGASDMRKRELLFHGLQPAFVKFER